MDPLSLATGFFLGVRHCFEPDHLTAVAQFASASRDSRHGLRSGLLWGVGHSVALVALFLAFWTARDFLMPPAAVAERAVGVTLIVLSAWRLRALHKRRHAHPHRHADGSVHTHEHAHDLRHAHLHAPTLTGIVHGTAGAVGILAVLAIAPHPGALALAFSAGTILAMGAAGWLAGRFYVTVGNAGWSRTATIATSIWGVLLGTAWIALA